MSSQDETPGVIGFDERPSKLASARPNFPHAGESDAEQILELMRQLNRDDPGPEPLDEAAARKALLTLLRDPSFGRAWLICNGQAAVAYVVLTFGYSLEFHGRDAFIDELFVEASHRGRGWGQRTLEFVEREAQTLGVRALHLAVSQQNHAAYETYHRAGFENRGFRLMSKRI